MDISTYQGGIPYLYTRAGQAGQRGGGFFSSLKRFLIPIGKAILPSVVGGVGDLIEGKSVKDTVISRGKDAGKRALGAAINTFNEGGGGTPSPPPKKYKRSNARGGKTVSSKQRRKPTSWT